MIRIFIFLLSLLCLSITIPNRSVISILNLSQKSFNNSDKYISWNSSLKLNWENFQGDVNSLSEYKAITFSKISLKNELFNDKIILDITSYFNCSRSWSKNKESDDLLRHEQLHFDITELAARKIRKICSAHISSDLKLTSKTIQTAYDQYNIYFRDSLNAAYDIETDHGVIGSKQKEWEKKIANELFKLEKYSSPLVVVIRK